MLSRPAQQFPRFWNDFARSTAYAPAQRDARPDLRAAEASCDTSRSLAAGTPSI